MDQTASSQVGARTHAPLLRAAKLAPALAVVLLVGVGAAPSASAPPGREIGFVVTQFHTAVYIGDRKVDCPDGMQGTLKDDYLRTQTPAERTRLLLKENEAELQGKWQAYGAGPNNANICSNVYEFLDRPPTLMNHGHVAYGFNLDNDDSGNGNDPYTCKHENFASPSGEKGIDDQAWRVSGCSLAQRGIDDSGNSEFRKGFDDMMMTGQLTQVILIRGVDSLVNDPDVEVVYANTDDRPVADSRGKPIFKASYTVSLAGRKVEYRNVLHGRIVNGVLTTDSKDIHLNGLSTETDLARGRLRLEFQPDGTAKGLVGGYQPLLNALGPARGGGRGSVNVAGINCAGSYRALRMMADGDKDPKTGACRRISTTYELFAVPGFVNDAQPKKGTARAGR